MPKQHYLLNGYISVGIIVIDTFTNLCILLISDKIPVREYKFGAMENWGLVTYDDTRLMVHPNYTSYYHQERLTKTMSHELVHMVSTLVCFDAHELLHKLKYSM